MVTPWSNTTPLDGASLGLVEVKVSLWVSKPLCPLTSTCFLFSSSAMCHSTKVQTISVGRLLKPCVSRIQGSYFEEDSKLVYCVRDQGRNCTAQLCTLCSEKDPHVPTSSPTRWRHLAPALQRWALPHGLGRRKCLRRKAIFAKGRKIIYVHLTFTSEILCSSSSRGGWLGCMS